MSRRLLILACSQRKRPDPGLLPAIERYDGPSFRVLRKFQREFPTGAGKLDVYVLSAEYGLISADKPIADYDRKMTLGRADGLNPQILKNLETILRDKSYKAVFINAGRIYFRALAGYERLITSDLQVTIATGTPGRRQSKLRAWLRDGLPGLERRQTITRKEGKAFLRGLELTLTPEEILTVARQALSVEQGNGPGYHTWYVQVDGQRVAPKWLVSQLTGLPVGSFHTGEARRVLAQLGIEVKRL